MLERDQAIRHEEDLQQLLPGAGVLQRGGPRRLRQKEAFPHRGGVDLDTM